MAAPARTSPANPAEMAARTRKVRHDDFTRAKIQTSQLVNRLMSHVDGNVELSSTQVTAALGLLKKALPDLASMKHEGDDENPVKVEHTFTWRGLSKD